MVLPSSGPISTSAINVELGRSSSNSINMNERVVRQLADSVSDSNMTPRSNEQIGFNEFWSKRRIQLQSLPSGFIQTRFTGASGYNDWFFGFNDWEWRITPEDWSYLDSIGIVPVASHALDVQFSTVNNLRADPNNWGITTTGANYGIRLSLSVTSYNFFTLRFIVAFFDRTGFGSTWFEPNPPPIYTYANQIEIGATFNSQVTYNYSNVLVAYDAGDGLSGPAATPWTLSRLKTAGTNNYLGIIAQGSPWSTGLDSYVFINSISATVETIIN